MTIPLYKRLLLILEFQGKLESKSLNSFRLILHLLSTSIMLGNFLMQGIQSQSLSVETSRKPNASILRICRILH